MLSCRFVKVCGDVMTVCNGSINLIAGSMPEKANKKIYKVFTNISVFP